MTAIIDQLAKQLSNRLLASGSILTTAESCTGGWLAEAITSVAGSSAWFDRGYVCYSNQSKQDLLGVKSNTLEQFGAVSSETAIEMANAAYSLLASSVDQAVISVAITGVAGPTGGSDEKPVGTVFIAWASQTETLVKKELFKGDRHEIRLQAVLSALNVLLEITQS